MREDERRWRRGWERSTYGENPPARLQLLQHHAGLFRLDGVDGLAIGETAAEVGHALGEADLAQAFVALLGREALGGLAARRPVAAARAGAAVGLGILFPPLALLPTIQLGVGENSQCEALQSAGERRRQQQQQGAEGGRR